MKKFWSGIGLMAAGLAAGIGMVVCFLEDSTFGASILLMLGAVLVIFGYNLTKTAVAELKEALATEKATGKKTTKKQITKHILVSVLVVVLVIGGLIAYSGMQAAEDLNYTARQLLNDIYDAEEYNEFQERLNRTPDMVRFFFQYEDELNAQKQEYFATIDAKAQEVSAGIAALEPLTKINSAEHYSQLRAKITELTVGSGSDFNDAVREKVENLDDLAKYEQQLEQLRETYAHKCESCNGAGGSTCNSCKGSGGSSCSSCGGAGKKVVTWYSEGDWGEKSYTSYKCTSCNGRGRRDCGSCNGGRRDCSHCDSGYYYIFEDDK